MIESIDIHIDTLNAAFVENGEAEIADILQRLATNIRHGHVDNDDILRDSNGNTVGTLTVSYNDEIEGDS